MLQGFLLKMVPFYIFILFGFISGRFLGTKKETLASILIYILAPIIVFNGALTTKLDFSHLSLPLLFFFLCCMMCLLFYAIGRVAFDDSRKNILAFTAGSGNTGYFGIPVTLALMGESSLATVVLIVLGFVIYENTLGFFIVAKGSHTVKESIAKLLKLPALYAFAIGMICNILAMSQPQVYIDSMTIVKGAYSLLGMMLIGMAISELRSMKPDVPFTGLAFASKFIAWPAIVAGLIFLDKTALHIYSSDIHGVMTVLSLVPLAANTVTYATELRTHPEKAALTVFLSTDLYSDHDYYATMNLLKVSRPVFWPVPVLAFLAGFVHSGATPSLMAFIQLLLLTFPISFVTFGINDIYDYETDMINRRKGGIQGYALDKKLHTKVRMIAKELSVIFISFSIITFNATNMVCSVLLIFLVYSYSVPPLRLKERPPFDSLSNGMMALLVFIIGYSYNGSVFDLELKIYLAALCLAGVHAFTTIADYASDRSAGLRTFSVVFGMRTACLSAAVLFLTAYLFGRYTGYIGYFLILSSAIYLLNAASPSEKKAEFSSKMIFILGVIMSVFFVVQNFT
jgi:malate permease and related proteins